MRREKGLEERAEGLGPQAQSSIPPHILNNQLPQLATGSSAMFSDIMCLVPIWNEETGDTRSNQAGRGVSPTANQNS